MPDYSKLSPEERKVAETNLKAAIESYQRDLSALTGVAPPPPNGGGSKEVRGDEVDQLADRFWNMSPKERMETREKNPDEHQRLLDAVEQQGTKKLLRLGRP